MVVRLAEPCRYCPQVERWTGELQLATAGSGQRQQWQQQQQQAHDTVPLRDAPRGAAPQQQQQPGAAVAGAEAGPGGPGGQFPGSQGAQDGAGAPPMEPVPGYSLPGVGRGGMRGSLPEFSVQLVAALPPEEVDGGGGALHVLPEVAKLLQLQRQLFDNADDT